MLSKSLRNKRGVSLIVSYTILVVIAVSLGVAVYSFLKLNLPSERAECPADISISIPYAVCSINADGASELSISLSNRGLFNIPVVYIRMGQEERKVFPQLNRGNEVLPSPLVPDGPGFSYTYDVTDIIGDNPEGNYIIEVQPAILSKRTPILCDAIVTQTITCSEGGGGGQICNNGDTQGCTTDNPICTEGIETCINGQWGSCEILPEILCSDDLDNDCDGYIDGFDTDCCGNNICEIDEDCLNCQVDCNPDGVLCSFLSGTQITMADGTFKNIEDIVFGDFVLTYNTNIEIFTNEKVLRTITHLTEGYFIINNKLKVTGTHPTWINGEWKTISEIQLGDELLTNEGETEIVNSIEFIEEEVEVHNLQVQNTETYFAEGILVHNKIIIDNDCGVWCNQVPGCDESRCESVEQCSWLEGRCENAPAE